MFRGRGGGCEVSRGSKGFPLWLLPFFIFADPISSVDIPGSVAACITLSILSVKSGHISLMLGRQGLY